MKKFLFICIITHTLFSCSTNIVENERAVSQKDLSLLKVLSVTKLSNVDAKKISFRLLNASEKFIFWKERFDLVLKNEQLNLYQKELISDLQKNLSVAVFSEKDSDYKAYFKNIFVKNYLVKVQSSFSRDEIERLFYSSESPAYSDNTTRNDGYLKKCDCNIGSLFGCGASSSCTVSCTDSSSSGCGFIWAWECNGKCSLF